MTFERVSRFTDFLVFVVDLDGNVVHLKSLEKPQSSKKATDTKLAAASDAVADGVAAVPEDGPSALDSDALLPADNAAAKITEEVSAKADFDDESTAVMDEDATKEVPKEEGPWPERFTVSLSPYLSEDAVARLKVMFLEGPEPPFISDGGWAGRQAKTGEANAEPNVQGPSADSEVPAPADAVPEGSGKRGKDKGTRGGRGGRSGRGGRGGGRGGRQSGREDRRKVLSDVGIIVLIASIISLRLTFHA